MQFKCANDKPLVGDYDCSNCDKIYNAVDTVRIYTSKDADKKFDKSKWSDFCFDRSK